MSAASFDPVSALPAVLCAAEHLPAEVIARYLTGDCHHLARVLARRHEMTLCAQLDADASQVRHVLCLDGEDLVDVRGRLPFELIAAAGPLYPLTDVALDELIDAGALSARPQRPAELDVVADAAAGTPSKLMTWWNALGDVQRERVLHHAARPVPGAER